MLAWVVNSRPHPRRTSPSSLPCSHSHFGTHPSLIKKKSPLSFHALTNCKFRNPFVLLFIQNARGYTPPSKRKIMNTAIYLPRQNRGRIPFHSFAQGGL